MGEALDIVTKNLVANFKAEETLPDDTSESDLFEHFCNFAVVSANYGEEFDVEDVHTGGGDDLGFDGIAIIVNGNLVTDPAEIEDLANTNKYLDVEFVFTQAKSGGNFDGALISTYFFGVRDLFAAHPKLPRNDKVQGAEKLIAAIYSRSALLKKGNPKVRMYYCTTGKWQDDAKLLARIDQERETLSDLNIFGDVEFHPVDARLVQQLYKRAKNRLSAQIEFAERLTLPALGGVDESYLGYLPAPEYLKLITDDSGGIVKGLFYDNVRDFQGENQVNQDIDATLQSESKNLFVLLNNGITIVADSLSKTGDTFTVEDYQIVNGCQSSHVLFANRDKVDETVRVPIKLIVSKNSTVKNQIIKANNNQTPVKPEELTALTDFQKSLEDFYEALVGPEQLYYERRSQQFRATAGIEKIKIVSVSNQIRSFASMFLELPHQASRYYGTLLKTIEKKIFVPGHPPAAYYASALGLYRFESLLRKKLIDKRYRPFRYHVLAALRMLTIGVETPPMVSNKFEKKIRELIDVLKDEKKATEAFQNALAYLDEVLEGDFSQDRAKDAALHGEVANLINFAAKAIKDGEPG